MQSDLLDLL